MKYISTLILTLFICCCNSLTNPLEDKVQTLELEYIIWSCACANWATPSDIAKYYDNAGDTLADLSIFVEPADLSLILPDTIGYNGDRIRFTGSFYKNKGFPKHYFYDDYAKEARVFKYTKFEILKSNYRENQIDTTSKSN